MRSGAAALDARVENVEERQGFVVDGGTYEREAAGFDKVGISVGGDRPHVVDFVVSNRDRDFVSGVADPSEFHAKYRLR